MGGKPSKQTPADRRLSENKASKGALFGGKQAPPFTSKGNSKGK